MGSQRLTDPRFAPLWILLIVVAAIATALQFRTDTGDGLPEPKTTYGDEQAPDGGIPPRDRISPLKDGTGT